MAARCAKKYELGSYYIWMVSGPVKEEILDEMPTGVSPGASRLLYDSIVHAGAV